MLRYTLKTLFLLTVSAGVALGLAPAAHADHSITVSSSPGAVSESSGGYYRVEFNTAASSSEPCRNWADAADAWVQPQGDERYQTAPVDRSNTANADNSNQASVSFRWVYEVPAGSQVTFASRVGCDTPMHIGAEGLGSPVTVDVPGGDEVCEGTDNRIVAVRTPSGDDRGLTGTQLYVGQRIVAAEQTTVRLGDGSSLLLSKGDSYKVMACTEKTLIDVLSAKLTKLLSGSTAKFEVHTPRAVIGVRGTRFTVRYDKRRQRTTVKVSSGKVFVRARKGSKKTVVARKGQTVVQIRRKAPRLVKR